MPWAVVQPDRPFLAAAVHVADDPVAVQCGGLDRCRAICRTRGDGGGRLDGVDDIHADQRVL